MNEAAKHSRLTEKRLGLLGALVALCLAVPLLITVNRLYASSEFQLSRSQIQHEVAHYAHSLSVAVDRRLNLLPAMKAFLEKDDQNPAESEEFLVFVRALYASGTGIRAIQFVEDGVIRFCYPEAGNQPAVGYNLLEDPRPSIREGVQRAASSSEVLVTQPIELVQGGLGIVARLAVLDRSGSPRGLVAIVIDLPPLLEEAGLDQPPSFLRLHLTDKTGAVVYGPPDLLSESSEWHPVHRRGWRLHATPDANWRADARANVRLFQMATGSAVLFLVVSVYSALSNHARLGRKVRERTAQLSRANRELGNRRAELETLLSSVPDLVFVLDSEGRYLDAHTGRPETLAAPKFDLIGKRIADVLPRDVAEFAQGLIKRALDAPGTVVRGQYALVLKGSHVPSQFDANVVALPPGAPPLRVLWVSRDVTELHKAREELEETDVALRLAMPGIARLDRHGSYQRVNEAFADMLGTSVEDLEGTQVFDQLPDAKLDEFQAAMVKTRETGEAELDLSLTRLDQTLFDARVVMVGRGGDPDTYRGVHLFMRDNSERKARDQAARDIEQRLSRAARLESLGTLAGGVAHDLNNILGPLVGYPDIILADLAPEDPLREDIRCMKDSALRAGAIIQDLLTMARRGRYTAKPLDLNSVILDYLESMSFHTIEARYPKVQIRHELDPESLLLSGSKHHLSQVIMNLIINAYESMPHEGTVHVQTASAQIQEATEDTYEPIPANEYVTCRISDTGSGIPPNDLERIFEPFFSNKRLGHSGSGLGLAVVYGVVKDHQGFIDVRTCPDQGTTFTLYFPAIQAPSHEEEAPDQEWGGSESILVVDDAEPQRKLARRLLNRLGYQVSTASDGRHALHILKDQAFDLVVLDMIMEDDFDGLDTYREIRRLRPDQRCIIASGFAATDRVREALALGAGAFIQKPYTMENIGCAIRAEVAGNT